MICLPAFAGHLAAGRLTAGQGDGFDARVFNHARHHGGADQQRLEDVRGEARAPHDVFDRQRALRYVRSVLEQAHVARHQGRREETEDLPEGKIPRHHGEHRANRLITDETHGAACVHRFIGQQAFGMLDVVPAGGGAFGGLLARGRQRLAHFERHDAREGVFLRLQDFGGALHPRGTFGERSVAIGAERFGCPRQLFVQLRFRERLERGETFTGGGVYGSDHYSLFSDNSRATRSPPAR